jgi:ribose transport system ATP-binding protein
LFKIIGDLRRRGVAVVYISHRMEEVLRLSDRVVVMRDGRNVGELAAADATHDKIVAMMVGRAFTTRFPARRGPNAGVPEVLRVEDVVVPGAPAGASFAVRRGEILGFAGLVGAGRTELMQVLFGAVRGQGGRMTLDGRPYTPRSTRDAIRSGVYLAPEDRKRHGLVLPMSVAQNTGLPAVAGYRPRGWLNRAREVREAETQRKRLAIKAPSVHARVVNLSGGNQQKVVLGKWLAMDPKVLILDEPTRGIDVGARTEIYQHIADLADRGITILLVSSDLEEVIGLSDRVAVMHERRLIGTLDRADVSAERVGMLMTGLAADAGHRDHALTEARP